MSVKRLSHLLLALAATSVLAAMTAVAREAPAQTPIIDYQERFLPIAARGGMVASPERLAAEVGTRILQHRSTRLDVATAPSGTAQRRRRNVGVVIARKRLNNVANDAVFQFKIVFVITKLHSR